MSREKSMDNHQHEEPKENNSGSQAFVPPRHWIGPEELDESYWNNPAVKEKRAQEFFEKPIEYIDKIDKLDKGGVARRDFLTVMGASMAMASFACARRPVHKIIPYVVQPEEITPGVATWYASTCKDCSTGCGVLIKNREGRPIKLEGNPDNPLNRGTLCSRGQASLLNLYDPDRLRGPVSRTRDSGYRQEITWSEADTAIRAKLKAIASKSGRVRLLTGDIHSDSTARLIREFLAPFSQGRHVEFEPLKLDEISEAQGLCYGTPVVPQYRFDQADVVVSLGADFLGTWISPVEHAQAWVKKRKLESQNASQAKLSKLLCFEPTMTITGANADERYAIRPGDEVKIALALAHELIVKQKRSRFANDTGLLTLLSGYSAEKVAEEIGIQGGAAQLKKIADELWAARGKSLIVAGSIQSKTEQALAVQVAVNLLNSALENEGSTIDGTVNYAPAHEGFGAMSQLLTEMKSGQVDALIVYRTNPAYTLSRAIIGLAFKSVPLVIVISEREDETALLADYVLPDHQYLEGWGDANPRKGLYTLQQPAIAPIHSSRAFQDSLLIWGRHLGSDTSSLASRSTDWHEYLMNQWKETLYRDSGSAGT